MALRTKTVEYVFATDTAALAAATRRDFAAMTLFIPENTSRTFRSVVVEIHMRDNVTVAASLTSWLIGIKLGAVAFDDVTVTGTLTNSGEHQSFIFQRDVTSYFNTNFGAGTSQTCQVGVQFGGLATINICVKLYITYEYDDAGQTTRVKTVRIPFDGHNDTLTNTLQQIGSSTEIPALNTFLPESGKTYRQIWFEIMTNDNPRSAVDVTLAVRLDAEAEVNDGNHEGDLISGVWYKRIWQRNDLDTSTTHSFSARSNNTTERFDCLSILLCVTYEYDHSASTTIINSLVLPVIKEFGQLGTTDPLKSRGQSKVFIEEPGAISLVQSGYMFTYMPNDVTIRSRNTRAGSQAFRSYRGVPGGITGDFIVGQYGFMKRIDAGGVNGAGATLARGLNTVTIDAYGQATFSDTKISAVLWLNYTSAKHANGDGAHNHTTYWDIQDHKIPNVVARYASASIAPVIPEASYFVSADVAMVLSSLMGAGGLGSIVMKAELLAGEIAGDGWLGLSSQAVNTNGPERSLYTDCLPTDAFRRYPNDPGESRLPLETARVYLLEYAGSQGDVAVAGIGGQMMLITYHSITFLVAGDVTGFDGNGSGITVDVHRKDTGEKIDSAVTAAGGGYSLTWYDNTINLFAHARQSATRMGRSDDGVAV